MRTKRHADVASSWQPFGHQWGSGSALSGDQDQSSVDEAFRPRFRCVRLSGIAAPAAASQARSTGAVLAFLGCSFLLCLCTRLHVRVGSYAATLRMTHRSCAAVSVRPGHRYTVEIVSLRVPYEYDVQVSFCLACLMQPNFIHTLVWTSEHDAFSCTNCTYPKRVHVLF
jgi:hypothetical protein